MPSALIVGNESAIGSIIAQHLLKSDWEIFSTSRRISAPERQTTRNLYFCDLLIQETISDTAIRFIQDCPGWNLIILSVGGLSPIGRICEVDFGEWEKSIQLNFTNQIYLIREVLKRTDFSNNCKRSILTFAGSGTNSAPVNFSAYTLSKIALIKATELLASEYTNCQFVSLGTGWIKSAIHNQTLEAGNTAGIAYFETSRRIAENDFGDPNLICQFIDWMIKQPVSLLSGLNIALQGEEWQNPDFVKRLQESPENFKLRKIG